MEIFLGQYLSLEALRHGVLLLGSPGTGKSLILKAFRVGLGRLMASEPSREISVIDFDTKKDLEGLGNAFPDDVPIYDLDPTLAGFKWDITSEAQDVIELTEIISALIPESNSKQPFFSQMARQSAARILTALKLLAKGPVTFRDFLLAGLSVVNLRMIARAHPSTADLTTLFRTKSEAGMGVASTITNAFGRHAVAGSLWESEGTLGSITTRQLVNMRRAVVRLPFNLRAAASLGSISALFANLAQRTWMLSPTRVGKDKLLVSIFDELALADSTLDLLLSGIFGREKGVCNILALQSQAATALRFGMDGKDKLEALLSLPKTIIAFNQPGRKDAEDTAARFGAYDCFVNTYSSSSGQGGKSSSEGESYQRDEKTVTASDIMQLPVPAPGYPYLTGYMATIPFRPFKFSVPIDWIVREFFTGLAPFTPLKPRPSTAQILRPWDEDDLRRLGLK